MSDTHVHVLDAMLETTSEFDALEKDDNVHYPDYILDFDVNTSTSTELNETIIIDTLAPATVVDMVNPVVYAPVYPRGEKGETGEKGDTGATGSTGAPGNRGLQGPPGKNAPIYESMTRVVHPREPNLPFCPIVFYFPIIMGISESKSNKTNGTLDSMAVMRVGNFGIRFTMCAFAMIEIKLIAPSEIPLIVFLIKGDAMVDEGTGRCINLKWTGVVDSGTEFSLSGTINRDIQGYWNIHLL